MKENILQGPLSDAPQNKEKDESLEGTFKFIEEHFNTEYKCIDIIIVLFYIAIFTSKYLVMCV